MNIICTQTTDKNIIGISAALTACEYNVRMWNHQVKPVYDMLDELQPSLIIVSTDAINEHMQRAFLEYKVPLILNTLNVPESIQDLVGLILVPESSPPAIMNNLPAEIPKYTIKNAADYARISRGYFQKQDESDVLYLTNFPIGNRAKILEAVMHLAQNFNRKLKCAGNYHVALPQYVGKTTLSDNINLMKSTKVCLDFDGEIILDAAANQVFSLSSVDNDLFPSYNTIEELVFLLDKFIGDERSRRKMARSAYKKVIDSDTYFHRAMDIAELIRLPEVKSKCQETLSRMRT